MGYVIFDLDGTVIDSSHRHMAKPNGDVDLEHWFDNAVPEKIMLDGLLPLARSMQILYAAGLHVIVCTARCMTEADLEFLDRNGLRYHTMLSRAGRRVPKTDPEYANSYFGFIGDGRGDAEMKADMLAKFFKDEGFLSVRDAKAMMFDDNLKVIEKMTEIGINCLNAKSINANMAFHRRRAA